MLPEPLRTRIAALPDSPNAAAALARLDEAGAKAGNAPASDADVRAFLGTALGDCPFLLDLAARDMVRLAAILDEAPETRVAAAIAALREAEPDTRAEAMAQMRRAKQDVALTLALADLAGVMDVPALTEALSEFADAALEVALRVALAEAARSGKFTGSPEAAGFFMLALGKQGGHELNYSSDIDVMALYEPGAGVLAEGVEPSTFWVRIVRAMVALLQERTADGYVFRTDLRLRPDPGATPVALSAEAALLYYESMGQNWERAALIKARAAAGDLAAGGQFLREVAPFIWRKYLDFAAIADIHSIKRQVHAHRGHGEVRVAGHDIKRGRGGIREIEFFVQTQQLIAGGRDRELRGRTTRGMLAMLADKGWIDAETRAELDTAYVFLRRVEHRLQMVNDEQTHTLPNDAEGLARIGRLAGHADPAAFEAELRRTLDCVARRYSQLFEDAPELSGRSGSLVFTGADDDPDTLATLTSLGFADPRQVTEAVRGWHFGRFAATRSTAAREALTEITPALLEAFARAGNPDDVLRAFDILLRALPAGAQFFALLNNNPQLLDLLATVLGAAPRLAEGFARRPHVVDALIDPAGEEEGDEALAGKLERLLADGPGYEAVLDLVRTFTAEHRFRISARLLRGLIDAPAAGRALSDLADLALGVLLRRTQAEFESVHGQVPGGAAAVLAFGRLGSREMTVASDLDLIVVYDHAETASASDGARPLSPSQYYARLTQRLVAAVSAPTAEGIAYTVDLRLRPSGRAGPLATRIDSFEHYQLHDAWTWEHMAMSRGRPVAGDAALMARIGAALDAVVAMPREAGRLASDIAEMRGRIEREKPAARDFDVKTAAGGLIDCEFAAQFLVLSQGRRVEGEPTLATLARCRGAGALPDEAGRALVDSAALQGTLLQLLRVADADAMEPDSYPEALKKLLVTAVAALPGVGEEIASFDDLRARLAAVQANTRATLEEVLGAEVG